MITKMNRDPSSLCRTAVSRGKLDRNLLLVERLEHLYGRCLV